MEIGIDVLTAAGSRTLNTRAQTLTEARRIGVKTAFLCHSHHDAVLAKGLVSLLLATGWSAYIDWEDVQMPAIPSRETARLIRQRIVETDYFLFLATPNSLASRWCPWEIGVADGKKQIDRILVVATRDGGTTNGSEYVRLYRRVEYSDAGRLGVWEPGDHNNGVLVETL